MNPITQTAFYCCGVRKEDADRAQPICGDKFSGRFMDDRAHQFFAPFKTEVMSNLSCVTRHRIIDDLLRDALEEDPYTQIVLLGCGFDSRPARLTGGIWFELDDEEILEHKDQRLPVSQCKNPLRRIAVDFTQESFIDKLPAFDPQHPLLVVIEGVLLYLDEAAQERMLSQLLQLERSHQLICDLMTRQFFEKYARSVQQKLSNIGASFDGVKDQPEGVFEQSGYTVMASTSINLRVYELGAYGSYTKLSNWLAWCVLKFLKPGLKEYAIVQLEYSA